MALYEYGMVVDKVVDGDTIDATFDLGFSTFRKDRVRIAGIDSPETHTTNEREKKMGLEAKAFIESWFKEQKGSLVARTTKDDKYGRMLATIWGDNGRCLNEEIVTKGYAWKYDGGTKRKDFDALVEQRKASAAKP